MFIEKRKRGKHVRYYAAHSFREGREIVKIRRYIGQDLSAAELAKRRQVAEKHIHEQLKYYREIRDPLHATLSPAEMRQLRALEARVPLKIAHLSKRQWSRFAELFSYNTNAIEGSTLTLGEVVRLIKKNKVPEKSQADVAEARGVVAAVAFIRRTKGRLSVELIKKLHELVFKETKPFAGKLRGPGVEVVIRDAAGSIVHRGAPSHHVEYLLKELVQWYGRNRKTYPTVLLAAVVHNQFENIHPFQDGNGRVGRLLLNYVLLRHGLPPINIELVRRQEYYAALQAYQNQHNIRPMLELLVKEYRRLARQLLG
jgi:Fic family protein